MPKLRTRQTDEQELTGSLKVLRKLNQYEFGVELWIMRDGENRNKWDYRNLKQHYLSFVGAPILCAYVGAEIGDGHNMEEKTDPGSGKEYYSFTAATAERIVGTLSDDESDFSLKERDGHTWIVAKGRLFEFYAPELVNKIVQRGSMEVSAETEVKEVTKNGDVEVFTDWLGLGVTILGDKVPPAIPGARIAALTAMQDEFKSLKLKAAALQSRTDEPQRTPVKKGVIKSMNKQAMTRIAEKFPGYRVVNLSEDGMRVALINDKCEPYTYTFNAEDNGEVMQSRIVPANLSVTFNFGAEEESLNADIADIVETAINSVNEGAARISALEAQLETTKSRLNTIEKAERERRIQSVKDAVAKTLADIGADNEDDAEAVKADAERIEGAAETYADMEADGKFCGDSNARAELLALSGEKRLERAQQEKKKRANGYIWNQLKGEAGETDGIEAMLAFINE